MISQNLRVFILSALILTSTFTLTSNVHAQSVSASSSQELTGTRKQIATIIFAGLAGAVLGLSTLSFYGRPQDKLSNIAVGFAIGVISGTVYTTYQAATAPYDNYQVLRTNFDDEASLRLAGQQTSSYQPKLGWNWTF